MGVFISGLRWLVLDRAGLMPKCPELDYTRVSDPGVEGALGFARVHHYQFSRVDALAPSTLLSRHDTTSARHCFGSASLLTASWSLAMNVS
jgi:hypothetical protein